MINNDGSTTDVPIAFDTEANMTRYSCSMTFENELYIFGGDSTPPEWLTKLPSLTSDKLIFVPTVECYYSGYSK